MKKMLLILSVLVTTSVSAELLSFQCIGSSVTGAHRFDSRGLVSYDKDSNLVTGIMNLQVQKSDSSQSIFVFEELNVYGTIKHYNDGEITANGFDQLILFTGESYVKSLNIILGFKGESASSVLSIDNFLYRANCEVLDTKEEAK